MVSSTSLMGGNKPSVKDKLVSSQKPLVKSTKPKAPVRKATGHDPARKKTGATKTTLGSTYDYRKGSTAKKPDPRSTTPRKPVPTKADMNRGLPPRKPTPTKKPKPGAVIPCPSGKRGCRVLHRAPGGKKPTVKERLETTKKPTPARDDIRSQRSADG